jgi:hypothetical protein
MASFRAMWRKFYSPRNLYNLAGVIVSILCLIPTVRAVADKGSTFGLADHNTLGAVIVAFWAIVPPAFFWLDWVYFCSDMKSDAPERDIAKHTHDLSRNVWLGLVFALSLIFFKTPGGE